MPDLSPQKLVREVELPRPRSSGAAVVAVASLAMFTAVGASAFVVRARMEQRGAYCQRFDARGQLDERSAEHAYVREAFLDAASRGDKELALDWYSYLPARSAVALELAPLRNGLAASFLDDQLARVAGDVDRGDCGSVNERLARLRHLLPEANLPITMSRCAVSEVARPVSVSVQFAPTRR